MSRGKGIITSQVNLRRAKARLGFNLARPRRVYKRLEERKLGPVSGSKQDDLFMSRHLVTLEMSKEWPLGAKLGAKP